VLEGFFIGCSSRPDRLITLVQTEKLKAGIKIMLNLPGQTPPLLQSRLKPKHTY
jgi:hypothetical protein